MFQQTQKRKAEESEREICEVVPKLCKTDMTPESIDSTQTFIPSTPVCTNNDSTCHDFVLSRGRSSKTDVPKKGSGISLPLKKNAYTNISMEE